MKCSCGKEVEIWDTHCHICGKWIDHSSLTSAIETNNNSRYIKESLNLENSDPVFFPNKYGSDINFFSSLFEYLLLIGKEKVVFQFATNNQIWKSFDEPRIVPEFTGYLRPYLLIPGEGILNAFHLGQGSNPKRMPINGKLITSPAVFDKEDYKRAFYGHENGIMILDNPVKTFSSSEKMKYIFLELDLEPGEKIWHPLLIRDQIVFTTSYGRFISLNAQASEEDLREEARLQGSLLPGRIIAGTPVALNSLIFFETIAPPNNDALTIKVHQLDIFNKSHPYSTELGTWGDEGIDIERLYINDQRAHYGPIVMNDGNLLIFSSPDLKKMCCLKKEGDKWAKDYIDFSPFSDLVCHWNCLTFSNNKTILADLENGRINVINIDDRFLKDEDQFVLSGNKGDPILAPPIHLRIDNGGIIFVLTANRIYLFRNI